MQRLERKHWLLLVVHAAGQKGLTPVRLQKSLFLLGRAFAKDLGSSFYKFVPYNYGPFDVTIYTDAQSLQKDGTIEIRRDARRWPEYYVTPSGAQLADKLRQKVPAKITKYLESVVQWTQSQTFPELVRAIYEAYPKFREHSVFRG